MKHLLLYLLILLMSTSLFSQTEKPLYPGEIPNYREGETEEWTRSRDDGTDFIYKTSVPTLTAWLPEHPNGQAVVVCPGGGYSGVSITKEGIQVAKSLLEDSITVFVLKYRTPQDKFQVNKSIAPLQDAQQAIRHVRSNAATYKLDPSRIGIMGFSAGGHLAATAATQFQRMADSHVTDSTSVRPDFVVLIYPVISMTDSLTHQGSQHNLLGKEASDIEKLAFSAENNVSAQSPPAFLVHAADDGAVPVGNSLAYYQACLEQSVEAEMHLYPKGGHGFGMNNRDKGPVD
ncbi:MAG: alpha/beta hydrolase [Bacteroidia bacterium]